MGRTRCPGSEAGQATVSFSPGRVLSDPGKPPGLGLSFRRAGVGLFEPGREEGQSGKRRGVSYQEVSSRVPVRAQGTAEEEAPGNREAPKEVSTGATQRRDHQGGGSAGTELDARPARREVHPAVVGTEHGSRKERRSLGRRRAGTEEEGGGGGGGGGTTGSASCPGAQPGDGDAGKVPGVACRLGAFLAAQISLFREPRGLESREMNPLRTIMNAVLQQSRLGSAA